MSRSTDTTAAGILGDPARPVIDHGVVFAVSHGGKMIAASESTGERLWTRNVGSTQMPWIAGDTVYVVDLGGKLVALGRADGKVRWASDLPASGRWSGPVLAGGKLWLVSGEWPVGRGRREDGPDFLADRSRYAGVRFAGCGRRTHVYLGR